MRGEIVREGAALLILTRIEGGISRRWTSATDAATLAAEDMAEPKVAGVADIGRAASAAENPVIIAKR
ncbi:hypothetical protein EUU23_02960 [Sphingorhabdus sp. IMCC26285]|uniref:Uncharacterized protein n=1 Tax=Sphingorhabdus profundilacus TaxID=2509718 RepID=A0A6I4M2Y0_9SPHN|nr:hypothetical protein [Sphingorhabdus profundilacus]